MSEKEVPSVKDALNEYFRLKEKFVLDNKANKKKILNNTNLSKREKRTEYLKLRPKCVNCKRPSRKGTIFSIKFNPSTDKTDSFRIFKATCGDLANPCNLDLEIHIGAYEPIDTLINNIRDEITEYKNQIINDKNKLLFGLITTESAIENFDTNKSYINILTSMYDNYLDRWNSIVDNQEKKLELDETITLTYENINKIKDCIKKMNENNEVQYAVDAANIYHTTLEPLLIKTRHLKYNENIVYRDDNNDGCKLIQKAYTINNILLESFSSKVISYNFGLGSTKDKKKKSLLTIESDSLDSDKETADEKEDGKFTINIQEPGQTNKNLEDEPIIGQGKDGIAWNIPEYQKLWDKLPEKLKTEFKLNIDWMKEFMNKCVNDRQKPYGEGCQLTTPPNLVVPPRKMENGQYDFGVSIYNKSFNSLPKTLQETYLTFYKEDPKTKEKIYTMLEDAMNKLVEKNVDFGRGFF